MWPRFSPTFEESFVQRMRSIPWLRNCGRPVSSAMPYPVAQTNSWLEAERLCSGREWSDIKSDHQSALSVFLHHNANRKFQRWNSIVDEAKKTFILPMSEQQWQPLLSASGVGKAALDSIQWDVLGMFVEHAYRNIPNRPHHSLDLLPVYQAGHFPCGWRNGQWPSGTLVVW